MLLNADRLESLLGKLHVKVLKNVKIRGMSGIYHEVNVLVESTCRKVCILNADKSLDETILKAVSIYADTNIPVLIYCEGLDVEEKVHDKILIVRNLDELIEKLKKLLYGE